MTWTSTNRHRVLFPAVLILVACGPQPTQPKPTGAVNIEGLQQVRSQNFEAAFVRPGVRVGGGRAGFALETIGEMTLVLELRDSQSDEVLVRAFDRRAFEGAAMVSGDSVVSTWQGVERIVARWASHTREGLENLLAGSY